MLREAFDYPYAQIADVLQLKEPAVRQLVSRARRRIAGQRRVSVSRRDQQQLLVAFVDASEEGIDQISWVMNPHKLAALA